MLTVALVVMVIFLFLRNFWATIIPAVTVPLSLIGTFAVLYVLGYSLDNLSLMALIIATGLVVDDAIVVLENVTRYIEDGMSPLEAALKGANEVGFTVLSMSVSLIAVFVPILLMGGVVGRFFREFAVTLSAAILVSLVVSLTLTPMMCARLLKAEKPEQEGRFYHAAGAFIDAMIERYGVWLQWVLKHQPLTLLVAVATLGLTVVLYLVVPKGFFPVQDTGVIQGISEAPQSISFSAMSERQQRLADHLVGLVGAAVDEVLALEKDARVALHRQVAAFGQRRRPAEVVAKEGAVFVHEGVVVKRVHESAL